VKSVRAIYVAYLLLIVLGTVFCTALGLLGR